MKLFSKKNKNEKEVCFAGTNESNCNLIAKLKSLQSEYKLLGNQNDLLFGKYNEKDGNYYRNDLKQNVQSITCLEANYPNSFQDIIKVFENYNKQSELYNEICYIKKELGIE